MITHYCRIVNKRVQLDGVDVFSSGQKPLDDFLVDAYLALEIEYPKFYKMDNLSKAGFLAAEVLFRTRYGGQKVPDEKTSLILGNAHASLDTDKRYAAAARTVPSPALFVYTLPNIVAGEICIRHKMKGENAFFISEAFDAELLSTYVSLIPGDNLCLAGWIDVMNEHHDVFLYLHDKAGEGLPHNAMTLNELYNR
ncbi:MAG TPA: hypothetical protein VGD65_25145 [Chryseosolibacter sp.]